MNKTVLIAALALVFASAFVVIGNVAIQSAQACPNTSSGTSSPKCKSKRSKCSEYSTTIAVSTTTNGLSF